MKPVVPLVLGALILCCCLWSRSGHVTIYKNYRGYCTHWGTSCTYYLDPSGQLEMEEAVKAFLANATEFPVVMRGDFDVDYFHYFRAFARAMEQKYNVTICLVDSLGLNISRGAPPFIEYTGSLTIVILENSTHEIDHAESNSAHRITLCI